MDATRSKKFYADLFKKPETIKSRNIVEYAKLLAPDVLVIAGTFDTNTLKARLAQDSLLPDARQARGQVADVEPADLLPAQEMNR